MAQPINQHTSYKPGTLKRAGTFCGRQVVPVALFLTVTGATLLVSQLVITHLCRAGRPVGSLELLSLHRVKHMTDPARLIQISGFSSAAGGVCMLLTNSLRHQKFPKQALYEEIVAKKDKSEEALEFYMEQALALNSCSSVKHLIEEDGYDPTKRTERMEPLIHRACRRPHIASDIVTYLGSKDPEGIQLHGDEFQTPFHIIVANKRVDLVDLLVTLRADINAAAPEGPTPLIAAIRDANLEMVKALLRRKEIDSSKNDPLLEALNTRQLDCLEELKKRGARVTQAAVDRASQLKDIPAQRIIGPLS